MRERHPDAVIMAGNIVTGDMTEALILAGADIVKVGIGSGSVCTTRDMTGVGYPQLSAVIECADAAHGLKARSAPTAAARCRATSPRRSAAAPISSCWAACWPATTNARASYVERDGRKPGGMEFYGMSSETAMKKYHGGVADYRASEGKTVRGALSRPRRRHVQEIIGGVRSACTYVGARRLRELSKRTTFVRVSQQANEVYGRT